MNFEEIDIHEILPQREPFIAIGRLLHFDMKTTITATDVDDNSIFVADGKLTAAGIIENIAQTCAARIGYINKYILKKGIQIGFIGAIRNLDINRMPEVGDTVITTIEVMEEIFGMTLVEAKMKSGSDIIATTEMKIAIKDM